MNSLVLKIATVPCVDAGRAIFQLGDLSDDGVTKAMMHLQHQQNGTAFLPLNQHKIVAISLVNIDNDAVGAEMLGDEHSTEAELLQLLAEQFELLPEVVCWGGSDFDLPVIAYRFLKHGIVCPAFWKRDVLNENSIDTLDLMQELAGYHPSAVSSLAEMAQVLGLSGNMGLQSIDVLEHYQQDKLATIRQSCEIDALNTYLIYLKFLKTSGDLSEADYQTMNAKLRRQVMASTLSHLRQFAAASWGEQQ